MTILTLWQPVLLSAIATFIAGAVIWMAMPWHKTDWSPVEDEERVREALRSTGPGMYSIPHVADHAQLEDPDVKRKLDEGPTAFITVLPTGASQMGGKLLLMFVYNLLVAIACAYIVSRTLSPGADYLSVFRIAGTVAFIAYGIAYLQESIWFGRRWAMTGKNLLDALIYAVLTGGIFGWLAI